VVCQEGFSNFFENFWPCGRGVWAPTTPLDCIHYTTFSVACQEVFGILFFFYGFGNRADKP